MPKRPTIGKFRVEIEGVEAGTFAAVENLKAKIDVIAYQDGNDPILRKRPGRVSYENVTLRKGKVTSPALWQWWSETSGGQFKTRTVTITLETRVKGGRHTLQWQLQRCWPCEWHFAAQEANGEKTHVVMVEAITFVVEEIAFSSKVTRGGKSNVD